MVRNKTPVFKRISIFFRSNWARFHNFMTYDNKYEKNLYIMSWYWFLDRLVEGILLLFVYWSLFVNHKVLFMFPALGISVWWVLNFTSRFVKSIKGGE